MSEVIAAIEEEDEVASRQSRAAVPPIRPTDGERLMRFWRHRDEAALAEVIQSHAGMVWGVCSQILRRREDVEDAFQATFLILARKAKSIRAADSAAGWLYRVAFRTALLARSRRKRLAETALEYEPAASDDDQLEAIARNEQCRVLLEELHALPLQYRQPLVLCYLEGRSRSQAADELGVTPQSVKGRLARGTRMLRSRMAGRGVALSTTMAITTATLSAANAATPPALIPHTAALAAGFALKLAAGAKTTAANTAAATLAEKGMLSMMLVAAAKPAVAVLGICLTAGMFAIASADAPQGDPSAGKAVLQLASADPQGTEDSVEGEPVDSADVAISAPIEEEGGEPAIDELVANEISVQIDGETATIRAGKDADKNITGAATPADADPLRTRVGPVAPAEPAEAPQPVRTPAAAFSFAGSADPLAAAGDRLGIAVAQQASPLRMDFNSPSLTRTSAFSEKSLKLEQEYWDLKAQGLKLKASALHQKAESLEASGSGSKTEILEINADAALIEADLKLCELNKLRVQEQLDALTANDLKQGSKGIQVRVVQQLLNDKVEPSPKLDVDGDFGPLTEKAVQQFQKANKLEPTGVVDAKTAAALGVVRMQVPGAPAEVMIPPGTPLEGRVELQAPKPIEVNSPYGVGGGVIFGGREGLELQKRREEAIARAHELARTQQEERNARQSEAEALRQQIESLRHALDALQQQHQEAAEEAARAAEEQERPAR